jgi:hypothetical protein
MDESQTLAHNLPGDATWISWNTHMKTGKKLSRFITSRSSQVGLLFEQSRRFGYSLYWGIVLLGHDVPGIPLQVASV